MKRLALLLFAFAGLLAVVGCSTNVGTLEITLVSSPLSKDEPLTGVAEFVRISVDGPLGSVGPREFLVTDGVASLPGVPAGSEQVVTILGLGPERSVVSGARSAPLTITEGINAVSLFIGRVEQFSQTPVDASGKHRGMNQARAFHRATALPSGSVLMTGGTTVPWRPGHPLPQGESGQAITGSVELCEPNALTFGDIACDSGSSCMRWGRIGHTVDLLPSGNVLISGGTDGAEDGKPVALTELYSTGTEVFFEGPPLLGPRRDHASVMREDSAVLVGGTAGGQDGASSLVEAYTAGALSRLPQLNHARRHFTVVRLGNGTLLAAGGIDSAGQPLASIEILGPSSARWRVESQELQAPRAHHTATVLLDGSALFIGGLTVGDEAIATIERYDTDGEVSEVGELQTPRWQHTTTALTDGRILVVGGFSTTRNGSPSKSFEEISFGSTGLVIVKSRCCLTTPRAGHAATLLPSGWLLVTGGITETQAQIAVVDTAETFIY